MLVIADIEANGLKPDQIFCVVCKEHESGKVHKFVDKRWNSGHKTLEDFDEFAKGVTHWVFHNGLGYDLPVLKKLRGISVKISEQTDTLVLSRLFYCLRETPKGAKSAHSLEAWGLRLGFPKTHYTNFEYYEEEMLDYCENDVEVLDKTYRYLMKEGKAYTPASIKLEYETTVVLREQQERGWYIDERKAMMLHAELTDKHLKLEREIVEGMLPLPKPEKKHGEVIIREPRYKKDGSMSTVGLKMLGDNWVNVCGPFVYIKKYQAFDLGSPAQKVERLEGHWDPYVRTKTGKSWQICEENLATLHADVPQSLKYLAEHSMLVSRCNMIDNWLANTWGDSRVHGRVISVGSATHRMAHQNPNSANIPSHGPYGKECRELWTVDDPVNRRIVGVDAAGIQLRMLAHYMGDPEYIEAVCHGDIHETNLDAMGIDKGRLLDDGTHEKRPVAKTFIYAYLLGAGDPKAGQIIGGNSRDGKNLKATFLKRLPALAALKDRASVAARKGYMIGLDGRRIHIKSEHHSLSAYLQGGETVLMRLAMVDAYKEAKRRGLDAHQVGVIHDEFQWDSHKDCAEEVKQILMDSIINAGVKLKTKCPMDADGKIGISWAETH